MKDSMRYVKIVEWSEVDQCYVGISPGLFYVGCHGIDKKSVFPDDSLLLCIQNQLRWMTDDPYSLMAHRERVAGFAM